MVAAASMFPTPENLGFQTQTSSTRSTSLTNPCISISSGRHMAAIDKETLRLRSLILYILDLYIYTITEVHQALEICHACRDPLFDLVSRILTIGKTPVVVVLLAVKYVDRILSIRRRRIAPNSVLSLFAVAVVLANKSTTDSPYTNKTWSSVFLVIPLGSINKLEMEFLKCLDYHLLVGPGEFKRWVGFCDMAAKIWTPHIRADLFRLLEKDIMTLHLKQI